MSEALMCGMALQYPWMMQSHKLLPIAIRVKVSNKKKVLQGIWDVTVGFMG